MIQLLLFSALFITFVHSFVKLDFDVGQQQASELRVSKRFESMIIANKKTMLTANLSIGSNKENVSVSIDTGSADLWVMDNDVECLDISEFHAVGNFEITGIFDDIDERYSCTINGTFDSNQSDTFYELSQDFQIAYVDLTASMGVWGRDDVRFGNSTISQLQFAVVNKSSVPDGILGIGIADGYNNFPVELKKQGLIKKTAYSIYLNSSDSTSGNIIFGAIDHAKYNGTLSTVPLTSETELNINVTYQGSNYSILLDTGSTTSILKDEWIHELGVSLNGTYDLKNEAYEIDCLATGYYFDFSIGGIDFSIPVEDFLIEQSNKCYLAILPISVVEEKYMTFGIDVLRSMYLVYDLDELTVSLAPVIHTADENIQEILNSDDDDDDDDKDNEEADPPNSVDITRSSTTSSSTVSSSTTPFSTIFYGGANLVLRIPTNWYQVLITIVSLFL